MEPTTARNIIHAKTATAGIPGTWGPAGATPPGSQVELMNSDVVPIPTTPWTTGQFMQ